MGIQSFKQLNNIGVVRPSASPTAVRFVAAAYWGTLLPIVSAYARP
jgi:hypothetical protein